MAYTPQPIKNEDSVFTDGDPGVPMLGIRQDSDSSPVSADSDYHPFVFNQYGRLKVATMPGAYTATTGNITTATSAVTADVTRASNVMVTMTGTFAGVNVTFEVSIDGGTTYVGTQAVRTNANTIETTSGALSAAPAYGWELSVNACTHVRVRATAWTSGTAVITILPGTYATEPVPAVQTHAVTQSGSPWGTYISASTSAAGTSPLFYTNALTTKQSVKASNCRIYGWDFYNPNSSEVYIQFFNLVLASVTVGTTSPYISLRIPANSGRDWTNAIPWAFGSACVVAATTTYNGATSPTTPVEARVDFI